MAEEFDPYVHEFWRQGWRRLLTEQHLRRLRTDPALPPDHPLRRMTDAEAVEWLLKQEEEGK